MIRLGLTILGLCLATTGFASPDDGEPVSATPIDVAQPEDVESAPLTGVDLAVSGIEPELASGLETTADSDETENVQAGETENYDSINNAVGTTSSGKIEKGKGMEFVWAAYGVSWAVLLLYTGSVVRRWWNSDSQGDPA